MASPSRSAAVSEASRLPDGQDAAPTLPSEVVRSIADDDVEYLASLSPAWMGRSVGAAALCAAAKAGAENVVAWLLQTPLVRAKHLCAVCCGGILEEMRLVCAVRGGRRY